MTKIRRTISITSGTIDPSEPKQYICLAMEPSARIKVKIMVNGYYNTSIANIYHCLVANSGVSIISIGRVEVPFTEIKVTLFVFDHDLSNIYNIIGAYADAIYLPYGVIITYLNKNLLPNTKEVNFSLSVNTK